MVFLVMLFEGDSCLVLFAADLTAEQFIRPRPFTVGLDFRFFVIGNDVLTHLELAGTFKTAKGTMKKRFFRFFFGVADDNFTFFRFRFRIDDVALVVQFEFDVANVHFLFDHFRIDLQTEIVGKIVQVFLAP